MALQNCASSLGTLTDRGIFQAKKTTKKLVAVRGAKEGTTGALASPSPKPSCLENLTQICKGLNVF